MLFTIVVIIVCIINIMSFIILLSLLNKNQKKITFDRDKKIVLCNDIKLISLREGSTNFRFIDYIFNNKNKEISISDLEGVVLFGNDINLNKVISNTNLPKEIIRKAFSVKGNTFIFNDHI